MELYIDAASAPRKENIQHSRGTTYAGRQAVQLEASARLSTSMAVRAVASAHIYGESAAESSAPTIYSIQTLALAQVGAAVVGDVMRSYRVRGSSVRTAEKFRARAWRA